MKTSLFSLFLLFFCNTLHAHQKVQPALWFRVPTDSAEFRNLNGSKAEYISASYSLQKALINGYPAVAIDSAGHFRSFYQGLSDADACLSIIVYESSKDRYTKEQGLWTLKNGERKKFLTSVYTGDETGKTRYNYFLEPGPSVTSNLITFKSDSTANASADTLLIGKVDSITLNGKVAEFLFFRKPPSQHERRIWESYLMLKYGVSMYNGNYLNSAGDTLWRYTDNRDYAAGVGGIGRDDSISLAQNFSTVFGDSLKIALHNYADSIRQSDNTPLNNGEYILWGHNGGEVSLSDLYMPADSTIYQLFGRVWKLRQNVAENSYPLDLELNSSPAGHPQRLKLFVSGTPSFQSLTTQIVSSNKQENNRIRFENVLFNDTVSYFTFGYDMEDLNNNNSSGTDISTNPALNVFIEAKWLPNPVIDNLYVNYKLTRDATIWFSVHTNGGIPMYQTSPGYKQAGYNETIIPMGHFIKGTYTIYVHIDDMVIAQTVIKK